MPTSILAGIAQEDTQQLVLNKLPALVDGKSPVSTENVNFAFIDDCESYVSGQKWDDVTGAGDIVYLDGNAIGLSYIVISKSPFNVGTETTLTSKAALKIPLETAVQISLSQRQVGQEFSIELIDDDTPSAAIADMAIASISQSATVLTVNTVLPHGLSAGMTIGIRDVSDTRLNHGSVIVSSTPSANQFTVTNNVVSVLPNTTIAAINNSGFVYYRPRVGNAKNAVAQIFEAASFTQASYCVRLRGSIPNPSGSPLIYQSLTCATAVSAQIINSSYAYAFQPASEFRLSASQDSLGFSDSPVDAFVLSAARFKRSQIVLPPELNYKLRIRAVNNKSFCNVVAKVVSISKTGTTTATVTTDAAHNLTTSSWVQVLNVRDQSNFPSHAVSTQVASTPSANTFTIVIGPAVTVTSFGGFVALNNGLALLVGNQTATVQSASVANGELILVGSATWTPIVIGDSCNAIGVFDNATGASLDVDGAYKVANINTTTLTLVPLAGTTLPADFTSRNCGGGVVKRTDIRIHRVHAVESDRQRVEMSAKPGNDGSQGIPIYAAATLPVNQNGIWNVGSPVPLAVADITSAAITTTTTTAAITPTSGLSQEFSIAVTAVAGTNPTLDVSVEETDDGTNWYNVYTFPRIIVAGIYRSPKINLNGRAIRYVQTIGGTSPSFTRAIIRLQIYGVAAEFKQTIDRAISLNVLNSTTTRVLYAINCSKAQMVIACGAGATVEAQVQLEGSEDGVGSWYAVGTPIATLANNTVSRIIDNISVPFLRARVSNAGTGAVLNNLLIKAYQ